MKTNTWTWIAVVLVLLIGMVAGWQLTKIFTPKPSEIKHDTISIPYDTIVFKAKLQIKYKDTGSVKWHDNLIFIPYYKATKADTIRDYAAYHSTIFGKDTIVNDNNIFFELKYGITRNKLANYEGRYFWKKPQTIIQNLPIQPLKNQLYVGINLSGSDGGFGAGSRITLKSKNDQLYHIGIDYMPYLTKKPIFSIGTDFKIKL